MQVFQSENTKTAFIHCLVFFCRKNSTDSRCKSGCFGNNINSRKRRALEDSGNAEHIGFYQLDSGNILLDVPVIPPKKESEGVPVIPPKKESEGVPVIPPKKESEGICKLLFASTVVRLFLMLQQFQKVELK